MTLQSYKKELNLYINLWKQLTYPLTHETAIKQKHLIQGLLLLFFLDTVRTKCNRK